MREGRNTGDLTVIDASRNMQNPGYYSLKSVVEEGYDTLLI
jgi:hypothetical protein